MGEISVVIVTFNNEKTIKECLGSLLKYSPGLEIIVIDNASIDKTCECIKQFFPQVLLIESSSNLGFGKANNLGAKRTKGEFLVFLNPDTILTEFGNLEKLKNVLIENPEYGLIGPKLSFPDNTYQKTVRRLPTVWGAFKEYILNIKGAYDFYDPQCTNLCEVESIVGACMIIRKDLFEEIEGFDEKYFLYFEDLELCRSVKNKGFKIGYLPEVEIKHLVGASGEGQKPSKFLHASAKKYHGLISYYFIQLILKTWRIF